MPLWKIYHPVGAFTSDDKQAIACRATAVYPHLPSFYVAVIFQEIPKESFYLGGKPMDNFVRVSIDHIARRLPDDLKELRLTQINGAIDPFVKDRGFDWEVHIDETPFDLWSIQGYRPPPPNSEDEKRWLT